MNRLIRLPIALLLAPLRLARLVVQSFNLAVGQIWANKLRSVLTTLGIIIGVASVTAVIAALTGMKQFVLDEFASFGANKIYMWADLPDEGPLSRLSWRQFMFRPEHFDGLLEHCPSVEYFTRIQTLSGVVRHNENVVDGARITGIEPDWHRIENRFVEIGRPFTAVDQNEARPVCLISTQLRDDLRMDRDCAGQSILINNRRYTVVGVIEPPANSALGMQDGAAGAELFIPFSTAWKLNEGWMIGIAASRSPEVSQDAVAEMTFFLRQTRGLKPGDPNTFRFEVIQQFIDGFKRVAQGITAVAAGVVAISLLVGGIGIMNIMLVSVSERTREIGLRKAVGARPSAILLQFLVEAVALCLVGGLLGLTLGGGALLGMKSLPEEMMGGSNPLSAAYIPTSAVVLAFGFSTVVGVVFGMFPAIKAALLDPIEALRHE